MKVDTEELPRHKRARSQDDSQTQQRTAKAVRHKEPAEGDYPVSKSTRSNNGKLLGSGPWQDYDEMAARLAAKVAVAVQQKRASSTDSPNYLEAETEAENFQPTAMRVPKSSPELDLPMTFVQKDKLNFADDIQYGQAESAMKSSRVPINSLGSPAKHDLGANPVEEYVRATKDSPRFSRSSQNLESKQRFCLHSRPKVQFGR